jgi:hypothetical protein
MSIDLSGLMMPRVFLFPKDCRGFERISRLSPVFEDRRNALGRGQCYMQVRIPSVISDILTSL